MCVPCTCSSCTVFSEMSAWTRTSSLARSCRIDSNSCFTSSISAAFDDTAASASSSCFECRLVWGVVRTCSNLRLISSADNPEQDSSTQLFSNVLCFLPRSCRCDSSFRICSLYIQHADQGRRDGIFETGNVTAVKFNT